MIQVAAHDFKPMGAIRTHLAFAQELEVLACRGQDIVRQLNNNLTHRLPDSEGASHGISHLSGHGQKQSIVVFDRGLDLHLLVLHHLEEDL